MAAPAPETTASPAKTGHEDTPAVATVTPLNWKSDELLRDATGVAAEQKIVTANRLMAPFKKHASEYSSF